MTEVFQDAFPGFYSRCLQLFVVCEPFYMLSWVEVT